MPSRPRNRCLPRVTLRWIEIAYGAAGIHLGDGATVRAICRDWFEDSPLDTAAWDRMVEALEKTGEGDGRRAFLGEIHILALYFLDAEQSARILQMIGLAA